MVVPPNLDNKHPSMPFVFAPAAWLQEAWRRKGLGTLAVPPVCILDPDGDLVRWLRQTGVAKAVRGLACYHTKLGGRRVRIACATESINHTSSLSEPGQNIS
jgi:hypothetical protein